MNPDQLRSLQAPLKEQYRDQPAAARITLRADGRLGDGVTCSVQTGQALVKAGLHPATGGDGLAACSGDMLLQALVACAGVTLNAVATALGIVLRDATCEPRATSTFAARSAWPRRRRWASRRSGCTSISTPTRRRSNWPPCCV